MKNLVDNVHVRVYNDMKLGIGIHAVKWFFSPVFLTSIIRRLSDPLKQNE